MQDGGKEEQENGYFLKQDNFKLNYQYSQNIHINII